MELAWQFGRFIYKDDVWRWYDTQEEITSDRPCDVCHELPTAEGYDPCLGFIPEAKAACCGHGNWEGYMMDEDGEITIFPPV